MDRCRGIHIGLAAVTLCFISGGCGQSTTTPKVVTRRAVAGGESQGKATPSPSYVPRGPAPPHGLFRGDEDDDDTRIEPNSGNKDNDADSDNDLKNTEYRGYLDSDDRNITSLGHAANGSERREVTRLVAQFYAAARTKDGGAACRLIYPPFAESIPEDYGRPPGPLYARGTTCAAVMSALFTHYRARVTSSVAVTGVRVKGNKGYVILGSRGIPASDIAIERARGKWTINALLGGQLP